MPTATQILLAWRDNKSVVARNAIEIGAYPYRNHAMEMVRRLSHEARAEGLECYMLVRERDGRWEERPCPPARAERARTPQRERAGPEAEPTVSCDTRAVSQAKGSAKRG